MLFLTCWGSQENQPQASPRLKEPVNLEKETEIPKSPGEQFQTRQDALEATGMGTLDLAPQAASGPAQPGDLVRWTGPAP
jgi:hypothetical protein